MNKLDETNKLIDDTIAELANNSGINNSEEITFRDNLVKDAILLDIAKSLAIIADKMNKEE